MSKNKKEAKVDDLIKTDVDSAADDKSAEIADLQSKIKELQEQIVQAESKRDDYLVTAQRVQAEFENYKKRTSSVRAEAYDDGFRQAVSDILPVMDNFDRALKAAQGLKEVASEDAAAFYEGVDMIAKQLFDVLSKQGLELVDPIGEVFDAELHNAAMQSPAEEGQIPGTIVDVFQKGYRMKGRMIRYAMVRVAGE